MDCIFCRIINGEIPSAKVYEDDEVLGIRDINPQAPVHIVFMPKKHVMSSLNDINENNQYLMGKIMSAIKITADKLGLKNGYRVIINCGEDAGQTVKHIHCHLLGGIQMGEDFFPHM